MKASSIVQSINSFGLWFLPGLSCLICEASYGQFDRLDIVIEEFGPVSAPDFLVRVAANGFGYPDPPVVLPPSGEPLELVAQEPFFPGTWEGEFDSLDEALDFVSGDWEASYSQQSRETIGTERITRDIQILPISEADVVRSAPTLLSPVDGGFLLDGRESLFEWEYETDPADRSSMSIFVPELGLSSTSIRTTPSLSGTTSGVSTSGADDRELRIEYRDDPQATTNRWLYEIDASDQLLPLDLEIQLGAYTPLEDFLRVDGEPVPSLRGRQSLAYVRLAETVTVRIVVPEPSTLGLSILLVLLGQHRRQVARNCAAKLSRSGCA